MRRRGVSATNGTHWPWGSVTCHVDPEMGRDESIQTVMRQSPGVAQGVRRFAFNGGSPRELGVSGSAVYRF